MKQLSKTVEELERPNAEEFQRHAQSPGPLLIRGAAESWRALSAWTPEYLADKAGDAEVPALRLGEGNPDGRFFYGEETAGMCRFEECVRLLTGAPARVYMAAVPIAHYLPALASDVDRFPFIDEAKQRRSQLWISGTDSKGPLHYDLDNNVHILVSGRKRFLMFEYEQHPSLYRCSIWSRTPHHCQVDAANPDLQRFPAFERARGYDVTLEPGDLLYIPTGCWHQVVTEEPSVAVNFWLGKDYLRASTTRILASVAIMTVGALLSAPFRAIRPRTV